VARDIDSAVATALFACEPLWRARGHRPILLLGAAPSSPDSLQASDVAVRIATPDMASLLREQLIAGALVWCGGPASHAAPPSSGPGRLFEALSLTELRAFAMVFQGLWAASRPFALAPSDRQPRGSARRELAGALRQA
jgi:hypothetical protein